MDEDKKKADIYELVLIVVAEVVSQNSDSAQRPRSILDKAFKVGGVGKTNKRV